MDTVSIIIIVCIVLLLIILQVRCVSKENYDTVGLDYGRPPSIPPTAYSALSSPEITSEYNKELFDYNYTKNNIKTDNNTIVYPDSVCSTPSDLRSIGPDSCAQYGIGEISYGPINKQRCVCVTKLKDGLDPNTKPTADNVIIDNNGVCTKNEQCITGLCDNFVGGFSKICKCPKDSNGIEQEWNYVDKKCQPLYTIPPKLPENTCSTFRKPARFSSECSLGEAVTPDGFCDCQLTPPGTINEGKFMAGANCLNTDQCMNNLVCKQDPNDPTPNTVCLVPEGMMLRVGTDRNMYGTCPDPSLTWDPLQNECVRYDRVRSNICPNTYNVSGMKKCNSNTECGVGEICDPTTLVCYCNANTFSKKVLYGGLCTNNDQCNSGQCMQLAQGYSVCK